MQFGVLQVANCKTTRPILIFRGSSLFASAGNRNSRCSSVEKTWSDFDAVHIRVSVYGCVGVYIYVYTSRNGSCTLEITLDGLVYFRLEKGRDVPSSKLVWRVRSCWIAGIEKFACSFSINHISFWCIWISVILDWKCW